jgi:hypothetical protein
MVPVRLQSDDQETFYFRGCDIHGVLRASLPYRSSLQQYAFFGNAVREIFFRRFSRPYKVEQAIGR